MNIDYSKDFNFQTVEAERKFFESLGLSYCNYPEDGGGGCSVVTRSSLGLTFQNDKQAAKAKSIYDSYGSFIPANLYMSLSPLAKYYQTASAETKELQAETKVGQDVDWALARMKEALLRKNLDPDLKAAFVLIDHCLAELKTKKNKKGVTDV